MAVLKVTKDVFESQIKTSDKVVMLDFYADSLQHGGSAGGRACRGKS